MKTTNNRLLERLQAAYSAVMHLSEQGYIVESVDVNTDSPKLVVQPETTGNPATAGEVIGAKRSCGCFVFWVAPATCEVDSAIKPALCPQS